MENNQKEVLHHNELIESINKMSAFQMNIFEILIYLLQKQVSEEKFFTHDIIEIKTKDLKDLLPGNKSNTRIKKALEEISNKTFSFKEENFSKKHIIFDKLELSENYENINLKIKRGYRYLFYPTVEIIAMADKALRKSIEDLQSREKTTYLSNRTKAKNFIKKNAILKDLEDFEKLIIEKRKELKKIQTETLDI
ncbi:RepB family plasmid replication initiator protein [Fusobacterium sp. THCT13E1]